MKRVLICIPSFSRGNGISKFIMTYYNSLIENTYLVDFLLVEKGTSDSKYLDVVIKNIAKYIIFRQVVFLVELKELWIQ